MDRDNEGWRSLWTLETISRTAVHRSGVVARVTRPPDGPMKDHLTLEHPVNVDLSGWIWASLLMKHLRCGGKESLSVIEWGIQEAVSHVRN